MDGRPPKLFAAHFRGHAVSCETADDAVAINRADKVFSGREESRPKELERMAAVLSKYDRLRFAESLLRQANRLRAAAYLLQSTGFELPSPPSGVGYLTE
jgi:hypothetical protein